jgi:hypothetical protein
MDWVWIAALAWVVVAIPLALLVGRYLLRSDELEVGSRQLPDSVTQRRSDERDERSASRRTRSDPERPPSRRSTPHPAAIRSVHTAERCPGNHGPGHDLTPPADGQDGPSAGRMSHDGRRKPPLDPPWRRMAAHRRP